MERLVHRVLPALLADRDVGLRAFVAEADDGSLVGIVAWQPVAQPRMTTAVRVLAVDKRFGDRGIGSALLLHCLEAARADGVAHVIGDFHRRNAKVESRLRAANAVIEDDPEDGEFRLFLNPPVRCQGRGGSTLAGG